MEHHLAYLEENPNDVAGGLLFWFVVPIFSEVVLFFEFLEDSRKKPLDSKQRMPSFLIFRTQHTVSQCNFRRACAIDQLRSNP